METCLAGLRQRAEAGEEASGLLLEILIDPVCSGAWISVLFELPR